MFCWMKKGCCIFGVSANNENENSFVEGVRKPDYIQLRIELNKVRSSAGVKLGDFKMNEYMLELKGSPFLWP